MKACVLFGAMALLMIVAKIGIPSSNKVRLLLFAAFLGASWVWIRRGADDYYDDEDDDRPDRDPVDHGNE
jgi:hypothetical protein